jgi:hypothetical protein
MDQGRNAKSTCQKRFFSETGPPKKLIEGQVQGLSTSPPGHHISLAQGNKTQIQNGSEVDLDKYFMERSSLVSL